MVGCSPVLCSRVHCLTDLRIAFPAAPQLSRDQPCHFVQLFGFCLQPSRGVSFSFFFSPTDLTLACLWCGGVFRHGLCCVVSVALPAVKPLPAAALRQTLVVPRAFSTAVTDVVTPECVDTLEWVLDSPPPLHQFEESPIIVEVAHLVE